MGLGEQLPSFESQFACVHICESQQLLTKYVEYASMTPHVLGEKKSWFVPEHFIITV